MKNKSGSCSNSNSKSFIYYLNKLNNKNKKSNIEWQHETLILRQLMIKTLATKPFNKILNLKREQIDILEKFLKEKNFIFTFLSLPLAAELGINSNSEFAWILCCCEIIFA